MSIPPIVVIDLTTGGMKPRPTRWRVRRARARCEHPDDRCPSFCMAQLVSCETTTAAGHPVTELAFRVTNHACN